MVTPFPPPSSYKSPRSEEKAAPPPIITLPLSIADPVPDAAPAQHAITEAPIASLEKILDMLSSLPEYVYIYGKQTPLIFCPLQFNVSEIPDLLVTGVSYRIRVDWASVSLKKRHPTVRPPLQELPHT